jgi:hypothetical protein
LISHAQKKSGVFWHVSHGRRLAGLGKPVRFTLEGRDPT